MRVDGKFRRNSGQVSVGVWAMRVWFLFTYDKLLMEQYRVYGNEG